jgi:hypothetical protein
MLLKHLKKLYRNLKNSICARYVCLLASELLILQTNEVYVDKV